jgi:hypothetical protein
MVDVTHDGDHGRSWGKSFHIFRSQVCFLGKDRDKFRLETERFREEPNDLRIQSLIDGDKSAQAHQFLDDVRCFDPHFFR